LKKLITTGFLLLLCCLSLCGCQIEQEEETVSSEYSYYYLNKDATKLETEAYLPQEDDSSYMIEDLIQRLGSGNSGEKEINLLPEEVTINSYEMQQQVLVIDFNSQYTKMSRTREILVRAGIVKTFIQIPDVQAVRFTVIGDPLTDTKGQEIGDMTDEMFLEYSVADDLDTYRQETFTLYFTDSTGTKLVEEKRNVYYKRSLPKERVVLEQLAKGPMEKGNYPTIPENTTVLGISLTEDTCYLDLDQDFIDSALDLPEEIQIYSVVNSLVESCGCSRVELSIEGNSNLMFGDEMSLFQFYEKNNDLIALNRDEEP
jgi:germination protein M